MVLFAVIVAGIGVLLALMGLEHGNELELPAPTGHFAVGRSTYAWVNEAATDELAPASGAKREVVVWIWYPAEAGSGSAAEYLPAAWQEPLARSSGVLMTRFLTHDLSKVRVHARSDAAVSGEERSYPVALLRAGGAALTTDFTILAEDLASHGYVVVGFDAPYRSVVTVFPDGRVALRSAAGDIEQAAPAEMANVANRLLPMWTGDARFVVDGLERLNMIDARFRGRLALDKLGFFGHSFGGATALQFCHDDTRCKVGIDLDGEPFGSVVKESTKQPFLILLSDHGNWNAPEPRQVMSDLRSIYDRLPEGRMMLYLRGANHFTFSDQILVKSQYLMGLLQHLQKGSLERRRGLRIVTDYVHTFFDVHLKGGSAEALEGLRREYPEAREIPR
jgi:pimeloyl-ACP methyl ester carboxylesterase